MRQYGWHWCINMHSRWASPGHAEAVQAALWEEAEGEAATRIHDGEEGHEDVVAVHLPAQAAHQLPCAKTLHVFLKDVACFLSECHLNPVLCA